MTVQVAFSKRVQDVLKLGLINGAVFLGLIILIEGAELLMLSYTHAFAREGTGRSPHTRYDPELGWTNVPNVVTKGQYGIGVEVRINSQGLREATDLSVEVPPGKVRLLCLGDSFTFGYGVNHDQTWCALLSRHFTRLETGNMGVSAYGFDQIFLRYQREGAALNHDITLVAVIADDFRRMLLDQFYGYSKPRLQMRDTELVVLKPHGRQRVPLAELSLVRLYQKLLHTSYVAQEEVDARQFALLLRKVLHDLKQVAEKRNSTLVIVWLPLGPGYSFRAQAEWFRIALRDAALEELVWLLDLTEDVSAELKSRGAEFSAILFHGPNIEPDQAGHYNPDGHTLIAGLLQRRLLEIPPLTALQGVPRRP